MMSVLSEIFDGAADLRPKFSCMATALTMVCYADLDRETLKALAAEGEKP